MQTKEELTRVRSILDKAGKLVAKGWVKNYLWTNEEGKPQDADHATRFCTIGAVIYAERLLTGKLITFYWEYSPEVNTAMKTLSGVIGINDQYIADWNNRQCRTQKDVVKAFEKAVDAVDAELIALNVEEALKTPIQATLFEMV